jgi:hypothetical protein
MAWAFVFSDVGQDLDNGLVSVAMRVPSPHLSVIFMTPSYYISHYANNSYNSLGLCITFSVHQYIKRWPDLLFHILQRLKQLRITTTYLLSKPAS